MNQQSRERLEEHSRRQRSYFETSGQRTLKRTGSPYLRRHVDKMMELAGIEPGRRVLEVGCGMGRYTLILKERGVKVEGLDLSSALLTELRKRAGDDLDIPVHSCDIVDFPEQMPDRFDAVIGFFVLHHVHDVQACIESAATMALPGGRVAFLEPNPLSPLFYVQIALTPGMKWSAERGLLGMRREAMLESMGRAGLRDTFFTSFGFFPPFVTNRSFGPGLEAAFESFPPWRPMLPFQLFGGTRT